jgi:hypothetical protein
MILASCYYIGGIYDNNFDSNTPFKWLIIGALKDTPVLDKGHGIYVIVFDTGGHSVFASLPCFGHVKCLEYYSQLDRVLVWIPCVL